KVWIVAACAINGNLWAGGMRKIFLRVANNHSPLIVNLPLADNPCSDLPQFVQEVGKKHYAAAAVLLSKRTTGSATLRWTGSTIGGTSTSRCVCGSCLALSNA